MEIIRFGENNPNLQSYEERNWLINETRIVEFFPNSYYEVTLISVIDQAMLEECLSKSDTKSPISIDLEWKDELSLFQFCFDKIVIIIRHPEGEANQTLLDFLRNHQFIGKGTRNDLIKLNEKFHHDFSSNIEDIAKTRLEPYGHSINFVQMTLQFAGKPTAEFKDVRITTSDWDLEELTMRQVLYAAFDAVAVSIAYPNLPPPKILEKPPKHSKAKKVPNTKDQVVRKRSNPQHKIKYESTERVLMHHRIILKQTQAVKTHCYLVSNYKGPTDCITMKTIIFRSLPLNNIDHIGCASIGNKNYIIISLFSEHRKLLDAQTFFNDPNVIIETLETVETDDCTDNDVLFIQSISDEFQNEEDFAMFLYGFGPDLRFTQEPHYVRIQPHRAQQSFIFKTFAPKILNAKIHTFPEFLSIVRVFMPPHFHEIDIKHLIEEKCKSQNISVTLLRRKTESAEQNALVTFSTVDEAMKSIDIVNYLQIGNYTCYAQRYTDENHIRFLRFFELMVTNDFDYNANQKSAQILHDNFEQNVRKRFEQYGPIFQCRYDKYFNLYRLQFINKKNALKAISHEKNATFPPTGTMAFIRNLPFTITDEEVLEMIRPFGTVMGFVYREIDEFMRTLVVEVMYSKPEEAHAIKKAYHQKVFYGEQLEVNAVNTSETEAPIWKMQQRRLYVQLNAQKDLPVNVKSKLKKDESSQVDSDDDKSLDDELNININNNELSLSDSHVQSQQYSSLINDVYYVNIHAKDEDKTQNDGENSHTPISPKELFNFVSKFGHVIDICGDYVMYLTFAEATHAQSCIRGASLVTVNEFVHELFPTQFNIINVEYVKKPYVQSQPMAIVIDPLPNGLTQEQIAKYLEGVENFFLLIDDISSRKRNTFPPDISIPDSSTVEELPKPHLRAIVYTKSKRAMNIAHGKLHNQSFNGALLDLYKYVWHKVPCRPKHFHPFSDMNPPRKHPIVVDPLPLGTKAQQIRHVCQGCGTFDVKIEGSAEKIGMCRAIVQPRNAKAKVNCFTNLENAYGTAKRYPKPQIPPILEENLEEESEYE